MIQHVPFMKDNGSSNHAVTVNDTSHKRDGPHDYGLYNPSNHGSAVHFDGNGDTITASADSTLAADNGNFTFEAWIYPTALNSYDFMVSMGTMSSAFNYAFFWHNTSHHLFWENGSGAWGAGSAVSSVDDGVVKINQWQHIALCYSGSNFTMWRNGKVAYNTASGGAAVGHTGTFAIGSRKDAGTYPFTGYMSDVRITQTSVYQYNTAFTPPTEPLTAITGTGLLLQPSQGIYDASGEISRNWKIIGNAGSNTDTLKYASSNMDFDGTGDYITFDVEGGLGDGDFTMEAWIRHDALPSSSHQSYFSSTRGATGFNASVDADGDFLWYDEVGGASRKIEAASEISNNTWYHVVFVRNSGIIRGYLNGVQKGSDYSSTTDFSATAFAIGTTVGDLTKSMNGQIEDFRLTKGLSRYPFAPAKETLTTSKSLQNGISCTASNVKLLALTTETVTADASSESHTITNVNSVTGHDFGPVPGMKSALFVEANDQKITMPDGEWKTWGSTFTIECWVYANSWPAAQNYAWGDYNSGGTASSTSINMKTNSSGQIIIVSYIDTGLATLFTTTTTLALKKWYHVAVVRNSGNFYLFLNGSLLGSNTSYTGTILNSSQVWAIGGTGAYGGYQWDGYISNFRINTAQALYSNTFTPPTGELTG